MLLNGRGVTVRLLGRALGGEAVCGLTRTLGLLLEGDALLAGPPVSAALDGKDLPKAAAGGTDLGEVVAHGRNLAVSKVTVLAGLWVIADGHEVTEEDGVKLASLTAWS